MIDVQCTTIPFDIVHFMIIIYTGPVVTLIMFHVHVFYPTAPGGWTNDEMFL